MALFSILPIILGVHSFLIRKPGGYKSRCYGPDFCYLYVEQCPYVVKQAEPALRPSVDKAIGRQLVNFLKIQYMKKLLFLLAGICFVMSVSAQNGEKKKPASPPAAVSKTIKSGVTVAINYSQPSVKGRTIGKDVEPKDGTVWRAGANKTTLFEVSKDVTVDGKPLAAGKYGLHVLTNSGDWTFIFSKKWDQWGTEYSEADDALRVTVKSKKPSKFAEALTYTIADNGRVALLWGDHEAGFTVK